MSVGNDRNEGKSRRSDTRVRKHTVDPFRRRGGDESNLGEFGACPGVSHVLDAVVGSGNGILIGVTRDGGAISVTLMVGEERHRTYAHDQDELDAVIEDLSRYLTGETDPA